MNKVLISLITLIIASATLLSCSEEETYAEQRDREISAIGNYINRNGIKVISEADFKANGCKTDTSRNEYVLFESTGVYMQIINEGHGESIKEGQGTTVICRFTEFNINADSIQLSNMYSSTSMKDDVMTVTRKSGSYTASFTKGIISEAMHSAQVPSGWLVPLPYIKIGRYSKEEDARVKLIVPHNQGHQSAMNQVYACMYDITYISGDQKTD